MTKEIPPQHRPTDLPPPYELEKVKIDADGIVKKRKVWDYCDTDKARQRYALELLRKARVSSRYSMGGQPGARVTYNVYPHLRAARHTGSRAFYLLDLKDAFPSIDRLETKYRFYELIGRRGVGLANTELDFLETYMHEDVGAFLRLDGVDVPGAPQGNATSGAMLDILLNEADNRMGRWLKQGEVEGIYTRWIDDLTFSSPLTNHAGKFQDSARRSLRYMLTATPGATINNRKTQNLTSKKPVTVTGITFTANGLMAPSKGILDHATQYFDALGNKLRLKEKIDKHDINVFDGYRGALSIAGPAARSSSERVRALYNRSIRLGNKAYAAAAQQGAIPPRKPLRHAGAARANGGNATNAAT